VMPVKRGKGVAQRGRTSDRTGPAGKRTPLIRERSSSGAHCPLSWIHSSRSASIGSTEAARRQLASLQPKPLQRAL
jgi:hypothetical protein